MAVALIQVNNQCAATLPQVFKGCNLASCAAAFNEGEASRACTAVAAALHGGRAGLARSGSVGEVVAGVGLLLAALAVSYTCSLALECVCVCTGPCCGLISHP